MLEEALTALAAAGGTAVVQAAGTDAWTAVRDRVAQLLGRGDAQQATVVLERLDHTAAVVVQASDMGTDAEQGARLEAAWQTRFEDLLEHLAEGEREQVAEQLRALVELASRHGVVSAGAGGLAAGGDVDIRADHGSVAAGVIHGGVHLPNPSRPGPVQG